MEFKELKDKVAIKLGYAGWHEIIDDHKLNEQIVDLLLTEQNSHKHGVMQGLPLAFTIYNKAHSVNRVEFIYWWKEKLGSPTVGREREETQE